jgi:nicotinate-nucleotide--dimethylbenzimidazole phosphoribosyltransferase
MEQYNNFSQVKEQIKNITPPDAAAMTVANGHWTGVCKPLKSLGRLEEIIVNLAGIQQTENVTLTKRCALVVCADNGVVAEGVTQSEASVSTSVAIEIAEGKSNINIMAKAAGADTFAVDVGLCSDITHEKLLSRKIAYGTKNMAKEPAMTRQQAMQGIAIGIELVEQVKEQGYQIIVTGEMGIGNTTTSSAVAAVLLQLPVEQVTGRGAGLTTAGLQRKISVITQAIALHAPDVSDPIDVLCKVGGFDIAAMTGIFLGGAIHHVPVVIDGFISSISALLAQRLQPLCKEYMLASHVSGEPAGKLVLTELGLEPLIYANMRLGEGTGGVCLLPLLDIALAEYHQAHRFAETDVEQYVTLV